jgi:hypothetical protein
MLVRVRSSGASFTIVWLTFKLNRRLTDYEGVRYRRYAEDQRSYLWGWVVSAEVLKIVLSEGLGIVGFDHEAKGLTRGSV